MPLFASSAPKSKSGPESGRLPLSRPAAFLAIAIFGAWADLAVKSWMFARLGMPGGNVWWIWRDVFGFQTSLNQGALFGLGQGLALGFAALSVLAALGILYWLFIHGAARDWLLTVSLALITAGICGNLYDRLGLHGLVWPVGGEHAGQAAYAVRDYILVMIGSRPWPNFNLADTFLVCGAALLVWQSIFHGDPNAPQAEEG